MGSAPSKRSGIVKEQVVSTRARGQVQNVFRNLLSTIDPKNIIQLESDTMPRRRITRSLTQSANQDAKILSVEEETKSRRRSHLAAKKRKKRLTSASARSLVSELENKIEKVPRKRAKTARKTGKQSVATCSSVKSCHKCGYADHHETVLLCKKCDKGNWFCPSCQQKKLIWSIETYLKQSIEKQERRIDNVTQYRDGEMDVDATELVRQLNENSNLIAFSSQQIEENINSCPYQCQNRINEEEFVQVNVPSFENWVLDSEEHEVEAASDARVNGSPVEVWDLCSEGCEEEILTGQLEFLAGSALGDTCQGIPLKTVESFNSQDDGDQATSTLCQNCDYIADLEAITRGNSNYCSCPIETPISDTMYPSSQQSVAQEGFNQESGSLPSDGQLQTVAEHEDVMNDNIVKDNNSLPSGTWNLSTNEHEASDTESSDTVFQSVYDYLQSETEEENDRQEVTINTSKSVVPVDSTEFCQKCRKSDHPDSILLCDKCEKRFHCFCLLNITFDVNKDKWLCLSCQQTEEEASKKHQKVLGTFKPLVEESSCSDGGTWNSQINDKEESDTDSCCTAFQSVYEYPTQLEMEDEESLHYRGEIKKPQVKPVTAPFIKIQEVDANDERASISYHLMKPISQAQYTTKKRTENQKTFPIDKVYLDKQNLNTNNHGTIADSISASDSYEAELSEIYETETESAHASISDHAFSPESDFDDESEVVSQKFVKTAKKMDDNGAAENVDLDVCCQKCSKSNNPEMIVLCDKCEKGYHFSCLSPALFNVPLCNWFCPICEESQLIGKLENILKKIDESLEKRNKKMIDKLEVHIY